MTIVIESNEERKEKNLIWSDIDWNEVQSEVERLQGRIYKATDKKDFKTVINLQKLAVRSYYVKLNAIRQVTQINKGKFTAGVDGITCQSNNEREELYRKVADFSIQSMKFYKPMPVKMIEIPKSNGKTRPIGIPTIYDRVIQTIIKTAMEPEFDCKFHGNSFGFRAGRSTQDAIEVIRDTINIGNGEYILDADLSGCFDNISHKPLLSKLHLFRPIVEKWLKAGVIIDNEKYNTNKGTPQGVVTRSRLIECRIKTDP